MVRLVKLLIQVLQLTSGSKTNRLIARRLGWKKSKKHKLLTTRQVTQLVSLHGWKKKNSKIQAIHQINLRGWKKNNNLHKPAQLDLRGWKKQDNKLVFQQQISPQLIAHGRRTNSSHHNKNFRDKKNKRLSRKKDSNSNKKKDLHNWDRKNKRNNKAKGDKLHKW